MSQAGAHLARTKSAPAVRKILCAMDFSSNSIQALERAIEIALEEDAELHLLHVVWKAQHLEEYPGTAPIIEHLEAHKLLDSYVRLREITELWIPEGLKCIVSIRLGDPSVEIIKRARKEKIDLIILGTQRPRRMHRLLSSSLSARIMRQAPCAVVTLAREHN